MLEKQTTPVDIDKLIQKLINQKSNKDVKFSQNEIKTVVSECKNIFMGQPMLLELEAPIKIVGDIHGQFDDLLQIFKNGGLPPQPNYLFLGDYVDRGKHSLETIMLLMCFKIRYPENFFMLRGNHEAAEINKLYGFYDQCKRKQSLKVWKFFIDCFNCMPVAAIIEEKIMCMHGGISPELKRGKKICSLNRPTDIPGSGLLCDILWSDPCEDLRGWRDNNERGVGCLFGNDVLMQFLKTNDLDLICRSHQIVEQGYEFFGKRQLVTIFSAPNYCGMFENSAALMNVNKDLICSFEIIKCLGPRKKVANGKKPKTPKYIN